MPIFLYASPFPGTLNGGIVLQMYSPVLSVLFLGILPVSGLSVPQDLSTLESLAVSPPAEEFKLSGRLSASGVLVLDAESGQQLYGSQIQIARPMASITKLMTALIIAEQHSMNELVEVPEGIEQVEGNTAYLEEGDQFTVGDLLSAALIGSANDAAETLAIYHAGSVEAFVEEMNARAAVLGLKGTHYANPTGLDDPLQRSTPQDIAWLSLFVLRHPEVGPRMAMRGKQIVSSTGKIINLTHTHALLHTLPEVFAGKTGTTNGAGQCLVTVIDEKDRRYLVVLLQSLKRYEDLRTILTSISESALAKTEEEANVSCANCGG